MLTQEEVKNIFYYDDGKLYWKNPPNVNKYLKNREAGSYTEKGYKVVNINKKRYRIHHIIFLYHHGYLPNQFIDHIDNNKTNNKIENLRECTASQNRWNTLKPKHNMF